MLFFVFFWIILFFLSNSDMAKMLLKNQLKISRSNREHSEKYTHYFFVHHLIRDLNRLLFVNDDSSSFFII